LNRCRAGLREDYPSLQRSRRTRRPDKERASNLKNVLFLRALRVLRGRNSSYFWLRLRRARCFAVKIFSLGCGSAALGPSCWILLHRKPGKAREINDQSSMRSLGLARFQQCDSRRPGHQHRVAGMPDHRFRYATQHPTFHSRVPMGTHRNQIVRRFVC
jgi:hypothetical protein